MYMRERKESYERRGSGREGTVDDVSNWGRSTDYIGRGHRDTPLAQFRNRGFAVSGRSLLLEGRAREMHRGAGVDVRAAHHEGQRTAAQRLAARIAAGEVVEAPEVVACLLPRRCTEALEVLYVLAFRILVPQLVVVQAEELQYI